MRQSYMSDKVHRPTIEALILTAIERPSSAFEKLLVVWSQMTLLSRKLLDDVRDKGRLSSASGLHASRGQCISAISTTPVSPI